MADVPKGCLLALLLTVMVATGQARGADADVVADIVGRIKQPGVQDVEVRRAIGIIDNEKLCNRSPCAERRSR